VVVDERGVDLGIDKAKRHQVGGEATIPGTGGGMLEAVERLVQAAYKST
jgi:hypothetical protein